MRITIVTLGYRGDVQPYVALGMGLRSVGHEVRLATHAPFADLVRGRGLDFFPLVGDPRQVAQSEDGQYWLRSSRHLLTWGRGIRRVGEPLMRQGAAECLQACRDAEVVVASMPGAFLGQPVAEKLGLPLVRAYLWPFTPTRAYPVGTGRHLGGPLNLATHWLLHRMMWLMQRPLTNRLRQECLGLPPLPLGLPFEERLGRGELLLYGFSRWVVPRPADWGKQIHVTGYWFLDRPPDWQPPAALLRFLEAGPPPVYIGFGSMAGHRQEELARLVAEALARAGQRGVLASGWAGLDRASLPAHLFGIDAVPHDWLFPRVAAVVHHGGAGTTAAGLRAGVPSVVVPFGFDQPFWGRRVAKLGVGPQPLPVRSLSAEALARAIRQATSDPALRQRAAALGARIRAEDGVARAVEVFQQAVAGRLAAGAAG